MTRTHYPITTNEFTLLMALLISIVAISIDALLPALGIIGREFAVIHPNQVQLVIGCLFAGEAIGQLIAGPLSDAVGRKPVLYGGIALYLVGSVVCYSADSFQLLLIGRMKFMLQCADVHVFAGKNRKGGV
jgi:MFS transporter, DHA1 family, multidrug resistance protein